MPFRIVRNDITKMNTEAIVNTANSRPEVGPGCDNAIYKAAGYDELLNYRREHIGDAKEGDAFITPGFHLSAKYIIHAVSPFYKDGDWEAEAKLRSCYRKSLQLAKEHKIRSIAFPLISTGSFGYPKEEGMRIAADEINAFLLSNYMDIFLVVFDEAASQLGKRIYPDLENYIDKNYVERAAAKEYGFYVPGDSNLPNSPERTREKAGHRASFVGSIFKKTPSEKTPSEKTLFEKTPSGKTKPQREQSPQSETVSQSEPAPEKYIEYEKAMPVDFDEQHEIEYKKAMPVDFDEQHESKLEERMKHLSDTYSEYLLYLIKERKMENAEVYKRAIVDKKIFSKIKNNAAYHPNKLTALCLCVGAELNLDETKDLLARAGYALSPCDKTDIIFSYFIENKIYDMIELDIQLEEHGLPCIIS